MKKEEEEEELSSKEYFGLDLNVFRDLNFLISRQS